MKVTASAVLPVTLLNAVATTAFSRMQVHQRIEAAGVNEEVRSLLSHEDSFQLSAHGFADCEPMSATAR